MSFFNDHKLLVCAGVAGVFGAGLIGYCVGKKTTKSTNAAEYFMVKSHYSGCEGNPIMEYVIKNSLREPELLRKLKEVRSKPLISFVSLDSFS